MYKIKQWWTTLGLVLLSIIYLKIFNLWALFYLLIGFFGLSFVHSLDDRKWHSLIYLGVIIYLSFFLTTIQQILIVSSIVLSFGYLYIKKYPMSAFYKGFGYSLLFFLPFTLITFDAIIFYLFLGTFATISETLHEAEHFNIDKKEGRLTTAHLINLKISGKTRTLSKSMIILVGVILCLLLL